MWLKIKVWTKITIASLLILYALIFIFQNSAKPVQFWWWIGHEQPASVFTLSTLAFIAGMIATVLISTTWKTFSQIRELKRRAAIQRNEKQLAELNSKAAMLKTRTVVNPATAPGGFPVIQTTTPSTLSDPDAIAP